MTTDTIRCPNCKTVLQLPPGLALAREIASQGGDFMGFVQADSVPCNACGHRIPIDDIVKPRRQPALWENILQGIFPIFGCLGVLVLGLYALFFLSKCS